ncbi:MAG: hypothetical protein FJX02_17405 [Alphaproteobacteria bacterium]|nr:hypothetical protein [Alphaproteobacteria bacterium]
MRLNIFNFIRSVTQGSSVVTRFKQITLLVMAIFSFNAAQASAHDIDRSDEPIVLAQAQVHPRRPTTEIDWNLVYRVFDLICKAEIREPKIVMQQAILETGWFRSHIMTINNVFGFRHQQYLKFDRLEDAVAYYKMWQDTHWQASDATYFHFLERIRYAVPGYTRHVRNISWNEECPATPRS